MILFHDLTFFIECHSYHNVRISSFHFPLRSLIDFESEYDKLYFDNYCGKYKSNYFCLLLNWVKILQILTDWLKAKIRMLEVGKNIIMWDKCPFFGIIFIEWFVPKKNIKCKQATNNCEYQKIASRNICLRIIFSKVNGRDLGKCEEDVIQERVISINSRI